jgi:hypothetical protein
VLVEADSNAELPAVRGGTRRLIRQANGGGGADPPRRAIWSARRAVGLRTCCYLASARADESTRRLDLAALLARAAGRGDGGSQQALVHELNPVQDTQPTLQTLESNW